MIDAEERQQLINAMLDKLEHGNAAERRAAAYWLGEAAAGDAVDELIKTYHDDDNKSVRAAAAYALGMFRAVDTRYIDTLMIAPLVHLAIWRHSFATCCSHIIDPRAYVEAHIDLVLNGLLTPETRKDNA